MVAYLVKNFGPDAKPRAVRIDQEMPLDEAKLGKANFIDYYLTPDPPGEGMNAPEFSKMQGGFAGRRVGQDVRFDQDGNVWMTDRGYPNRLVRLDPRTGEQKAYVLPNPISGNHNVNIDRTGIIWLAEPEGQQPSGEKRLLGFNPKTEKFEYLIPMDPDNVIRSPRKWLQSMAFDSKKEISGPRTSAEAPRLCGSSTRETRRLRCIQNRKRPRIHQSRRFPSAGPPNKRDGTL